ALDRLGQLGAVRGVEGVRDEARQVMQHVGVAAPGGGARRVPRQAPPVRGGEIGGRLGLPGVPQQAAEAGHAGLGARQEQELVPLVEAHQGGARPPLPLRRAPAVMDEDPGDEVLAQTRIVQPPLLLDREIGQARRQRRGEEAAPLLRGGAGSGIDLDPLQAAARRILLEHIAVELHPGQRLGPPPGPFAHRSGIILSRARHDEAHLAAPPLQPDRRPRGAHPQLHLGTDRHPVDVASEDVGEEGVPLVAAVVAHLLAQQAGGDADADSGGLAGHPLVIARWAGWPQRWAGRPLSWAGWPPSWAGRPPSWAAPPRSWAGRPPRSARTATRLARPPPRWARPPPRWARPPPRWARAPQAWAGAPQRWARRALTSVQTPPRSL